MFEADSAAEIVRVVQLSLRSMCSRHSLSLCVGATDEAEGPIISEDVAVGGASSESPQPIEVAASIKMELAAAITGVSERGFRGVIDHLEFRHEIFEIR
jgi:hypothetical protein